MLNTVSHVGQKCDEPFKLRTAEFFQLDEETCRILDTIRVPSIDSVSPKSVQQGEEISSREASPNGDVDDEEAEQLRSHTPVSSCDSVSLQWQVFAAKNVDGDYKEGVRVQHVADRWQQRK